MFSSFEVHASMQILTHVMLIESGWLSCKLLQNITDDKLPDIYTYMVTGIIICGKEKLVIYCFQYVWSDCVTDPNYYFIYTYICTFQNYVRVCWVWISYRPNCYLIYQFQNCAYVGSEFVTDPKTSVDF
jgi:hypothetical protein